MFYLMNFRLAASSYLNSAPLIWSFLYGPHQGSIDFVEAVPARCAQLLADSSVEGALVPVIEYQRIAGGSLVQNVCVGSRKEVLSVVLVSKNKHHGKVVGDVHHRHPILVAHFRDTREGHLSRVPGPRT